MSLATGGRAIGATSTRSSSASGELQGHLDLHDPYLLPSRSDEPDLWDANAIVDSRFGADMPSICLSTETRCLRRQQICERARKTETGQRSLRRPVKTTERRHTGRPPPQTDPAINVYHSGGRSGLHLQIQCDTGSVNQNVTTRATYSPAFRCPYAAGTAHPNSFCTISTSRWPAASSWSTTPSMDSV